MGYQKITTCKECGTLITNAHGTTEYCGGKSCKDRYHHGLRVQLKDERFKADWLAQICARRIAAIYQEVGAEVKDFELEQFLIRLDEAILNETNKFGQPVFVFYDFEIHRISEGRYRIKLHERPLYDIVREKALEKMKANTAKIKATPIPIPSSNQIDEVKPQNQNQTQTWAKAASNVNFLAFFDLLK